MSYPTELTDSTNLGRDRPSVETKGASLGRGSPATESSSYGDNELALTLFPECRDWLEEDHRYDHTPEMYISVYFNRTNDLAYQYRMVRYMELRPTEANKNIVNAWYKDLRKKRSNSFDDKPILPGVPDYPVFAL